MDADAAATPPPPPPPGGPPPPPPPEKKEKSGCARAALIGCGVLLVLGIIAVAVGVWAWNKYSPGLVEASTEAAQEGQAVGLETDEAGCVAAAKERGATATDVGSMAAVGGFAAGCLRVAEETPGFCDGVPEPTEFIASARWAQEQCAAQGDATQACALAMESAKRYCQEGRPKGGFQGVQVEPLPAGEPAGEGVSVEGVEPGAAPQP